MKADNDSLTDQDRDTLKETVYNRIVEPSHMEYIRMMLATVNQENVRKTYQGYYTFPKPDPKGRLETVMSNNYGNIKTPWFLEDYEKDYYKKDRQQLVDIQISEELKNQVGSGSLVIQLETKIREDEGWHEEVMYGINIAYRRDKMFEYNLYTEGKTWADAEAHCQDEGGHLASVLKNDEQEEVRALAGNLQEGTTRRKRGGGGGPLVKK